MIGLQTPLWLLLLGMIPLIRWLHRFRQQSRTFPSTTLFLWQVFQHHSERNGAPAKPDPLWILRAIIITLLVLSLSEPFVQTEDGQTIEVWLDDSLSMFAVEDDQQRIQQGIEQLQAYLAESKPTQILVHSLGNPASSLLLEAKDIIHWAAKLAAWTTMPRGEPSPPPPATLSSGSRHILLTDGADRLLNRWMTSAPLQHVIQVGNATQNIALTRLSLREPMTMSTNLNGIARIDNLDDNPQQTRLILQLDDRVIKTQLVDITPSGKSITPFTLPKSERGRLQARLESATDSLPMDDKLHLDLEQLNPLVRYQIQGTCGPHVIAVLDSYPGLIQDTKNPDVRINCSGQTHAAILPTLRLHPGGSIRQTTQTAHWHNSATMDSLQMGPGLPYSNEAPALTSSATPILSADRQMLVLKQKGSGHIIDSYLDTSDSIFARHPEYPLLIIGLIGQLTGQVLDNSPLTVARDIDASRIKPAVLTSISMSLAEMQTTRTSFAHLLLFTSLLMLVLDVALTSGLIHGFGKRHR